MTENIESIRWTARGVIRRKSLGVIGAALVAGAIGCSERGGSSEGHVQATGAATQPLLAIAEGGASYRLVRTPRDLLDARLPASADGAMRMSVAREPGAWIDVRLLGAAPSIAEQQGDTLVHHDAKPGVDLVRASKRGPNGALGVEDLLVAHRTAPNVSGSFEIGIGPAMGSARLVAGRVEIVDRGGHVRIASEPMVASDARGRSLDVTTRLDPVDGATYALAIDVDTNGAAFPVVVDPAWTLVTGAMATPRTAHASVQLPSGLVIIIGGFDGGTVQSTYETLDLGNGVFTTPTHQVLLSAHEFFDAFLMPSGSVLVAGGTGGGDEATAELLNPATFFATTVNMIDPRGNYVGLQLPGAERRVVVAGGESSIEDEAGANATLSSAEIFDESLTPPWTPLPSMSTPRDFAGGAVMSDGRIVVVGGSNDAAVALSTAEAFDPANETAPWVPLGALNHAVAFPAVVRASDGMIYVIGGQDLSSNPADDIERYDTTLASPHWVSVGHLQTARSGAIVVSLGTAGILVVGGFGPLLGPDHKTVNPLSTAEILTPGATTTTTPAPSMRVPRTHASAVLLADGRILVTGGAPGDDSFPYSSAEIYDPDAGTADGGADGGPDGAIDAVDAIVANDASDTADATIPIDSNGADTIVAADAAPAADAADANGTKVDAALDAMPPPSIQGSAEHCTTSTSCNGGVCVDGICCDRACSDPCYSCVLPTSPGICSVEPLGVDLGNQCRSSTCFGTCDGTGHCAGSVQGSQCAPSSCTGASTGVGPAFCAAEGAACPTSAQVAFDCGAYACDKAFGSCISTCRTTDDCAPGNVCDPTSHDCVPGSHPSSGGCGCEVEALGEPPMKGHDATFMLLVGIAAIATRRRSSASPLQS